mmetsp:Transcript_26180/g.82862  ORF Transcript_26180/g.82862 Transcript_26180/m.82862 type:complete len:317 (-) Transcript_26180:1526-2476(-)
MPLRKCLPVPCRSAHGQRECSGCIRAQWGGTAERRETPHAIGRTAKEPRERRRVCGPVAEKPRKPGRGVARVWRAQEAEEPAHGDLRFVLRSLAPATGADCHEASQADVQRHGQGQPCHRAEASVWLQRERQEPELVLRRRGCRRRRAAGRCGAGPGACRGGRGAGGCPARGGGAGGHRACHCRGSACGGRRSEGIGGAGRGHRDSARGGRRHVRHVRCLVAIPLRHHAAVCRSRTPLIDDVKHLSPPIQVDREGRDKAVFEPWGHNDASLCHHVVVTEVVVHTHTIPVVRFNTAVHMVASVAGIAVILCDIVGKL